MSVQGNPDKIVSQLDAMKLLSWAERIVSIEDIQNLIGVSKGSNWVDQAESAFPEVPAKWEFDAAKPYGKPAGQRPSIKIRQSKKKRRR